MAFAFLPFDKFVTNADYDISASINHLKFLLDFTIEGKGLNSLHVGVLAGYAVTLTPGGFEKLQEIFFTHMACFIKRFPSYMRHRNRSTYSFVKHIDVRSRLSFVTIPSRFLRGFRLVKQKHACCPNIHHSNQRQHCRQPLTHWFAYKLQHFASPPFCLRVSKISSEPMSLCPAGVKVKACHNRANTIVQLTGLSVPRVIERIDNITTAIKVYQRKANSIFLLLKGLLIGAWGA